MERHNTSAFQVLRLRRGLGGGEIGFVLKEIIQKHLTNV